MSVLCGLIVQAILWAPLPAQAAVFYVSTTGSNSNPGTSASPWRTIAYAVAKMNPGDTSYVRGGIYDEVGVQFGRSGTASAPIRLLNAPGESPVIDFGKQVRSVVIQNRLGILNPIGHITIEGFEIRNGHFGIVMYNGHNITIRRNWIHHAASQGIHGNGKVITVDGNVISRNGNFSYCAETGKACNLMHGIYGTGPNWVITNNLIYDNLSNGIVVAGYEHCPQGGCYGGSETGKPKVYAGHDYGGADNWLIANNTIAYNNYRDAIVLWMPLTTNSKIINNIFYENSQKYSYGVNGVTFFYSPGKGHLIQNNICYATAPGGTPCIGPNGQGKYTGSGNIVNTLPPKFVNAPAAMPAVPDFRLTSSSPAVNAGINLFASGVTTDFGGKARPQSGPFEIGAYEFGAAPPPVVKRPSMPEGFTVR